MTLSTPTIQVPILMYHSISQTQNTKFRPFTVSPLLFAAQMRYLSAAGYTPITVTQFIQAISDPDEQELPARPVILTFDDGFADFFLSAFPILQHYQFTATLYVTTAFIEGTSSWLRREGESTRPMISNNQLRHIHHYGIECGGHTHSHPQLDTIELDKARQEILQCKDILEQLLGRRVSSFAYPFGYTNPAVQDLVREAGYTSACTVQHRMTTSETDHFALTRLMVNASTTLDEFRRLLNGSAFSGPQALYLHMRTPLWSVVRKSSAFVSKHLQKRGETCDIPNL
jgi:peptidoglycan/xylan/chitin deacetylase (PgdA/CDA1 family)